jgi:1,4-alpha-glucan branching enzyme
MIEKMPGNWWEKCANLRAYYGFMWGHPGKKLLFMGCEFGQPEEWNHQSQINWDAAGRPEHRGIAALVRDLNALYRTTPALHRFDCEARGFEWIDGGDADNSVLSFIRHGDEGDAPVVVVCNFTPVERTDHRIGFPVAGHWAEVINTDAAVYGGGNRGNLGGVAVSGQPCSGQPTSAAVTLPPLSTLIFRLGR